MTTSSAAHRIKELIADVCALDIAQIHDDGRLVGYGLDSVRITEILLAIEAEYDIEVSEDDPELYQVRTVGELAAFVERRRRP